MFKSKVKTMEKLAVELNKTLKETTAYSMLSDYGRRMYVPKGIVVQGAEAKKKATKYNATVGVALEKNQAMCLSGAKEQFASSMKVGEIFPYAPMGGVPALRQKWQEEMLKKNPDLKGVKTSLPVVCSGLTNCLSIVFSLFVDKKQPVILPNLYWENYNLIIDEQVQAKKVLFNFFEKDHFNVKGFDSALASVKENKVAVLLNFPNNPTGYTPTEKESDQIAKVLRKHAKAGKLMTVICDDAYFGLFYEKDVCKQSLFAKLANLDKNILAVKCDGATKEEMVWGFRVAFITYAGKGLKENHLDALCQKTLGAIRGSISSCSLSGQNIILKAMEDPRHNAEKKANIKTVKDRYTTLKKVLKKYEDCDCLKALPYNSGYFMSFVTKCNAEELRQLLLNKYETGVITLGEHLIRIAYSSVDKENISGFVKTLYKAAAEL